MVNEGDLSVKDRVKLVILYACTYTFRYTLNINKPAHIHMYLKYTLNVNQLVVIHSWALFWIKMEFIVELRSFVG